MGDKPAKPISFGMAGGKAGTMAIVFFIVMLVLTILTHVGGAVSGELKDRRARPQLAVKTFLRDVREFIAAEKKFPANLRELELKVWHKNAPGKPSSLIYGDKIWVAENYEYIYFTGEVGGAAQANIWANPLGKFREQAETVLVVVTRDGGEDVWRGPALTDEHRQLIESQGFNPSLAMMAKLSMSKNPKSSAADQSAPMKKFGIF